MIFKIKTEFSGTINNVEFDNERICYTISAIIEEFEDDFEIDINDEDFTKLLSNVFVEFQHNVAYADKYTDKVEAIYDFIRFRFHCYDEMAENTDIEIFKVLNDKYERIITVHDEKLDEVAKNLTGNKVATYKQLFKIFYERFKQQYLDSLIF